MKATPLRLRQGSALLIILAFVTLITVLVMSLLLTARFERTASSLALGRGQAEVLADLTADVAMGRISEAIAEGTKANRSWASEPGRIHVFSIAPGTGEIFRTPYDLFSALPGADNTQTPDLNNVDLNKASLSGTHPVTGGRPGTMKVGWLNMTADPDAPASATNQIIGRMAYWVDDESCKVNINTADGSQRNSTPAQMAASQNYSYGFGTPSEISLAVLPGLDLTKAGAIAASAWLREFNSLEELTRATDLSGAQVASPSVVEDLRFDVTHYNSSPDVNFMGEPRIDLLFRPNAAAGAVPRQNIMLGPYQKSQAQDSTVIGFVGLTLDHMYPQPGQLVLPAYLPANKLFLHTFSAGGQKLTQTGANVSNDFYVGSVITKFLTGINLKGQNFAWPKFNGAGSSGFAGKYTARQLDSITLQILDTAGKTAFVDQFRPYSMLGIMDSGWLSGQPVLGVGRAPKLTEILIDATATIGDPFTYGTAYPLLQMSISLELYVPKNYQGMPMNAPYDGASSQWGTYPGTLPVGTLNFYDFPPLGTTGVAGPSAFGSVWMESMLKAVDQNGLSAGIDMLGTSSMWEDPDQPRAAAEHPYCLNSSTGRYSGSVPLTSARTTGFVEYLGPFGGTMDRAPGCYVTRKNRYPTFLHAGKIGTTSLRIFGGLLYSTHYESNSSGYVCPILTPLDSMMPELQGTGLSPAVIQQINSSLIPVDFTVNVPGIQHLLLRTADPLVNQFPGDWESILNPSTTDITLTTVGNSGMGVYLKGGVGALDPFYPPKLAPSFSGDLNYISVRPTNYDGDNIRFRPSGGGDPLSVWLPTQDTRIPKQARFPSIGALFSLRTGVYPDRSVASAPIAQQHGVPFRCLNMSPSTQASQGTDGGSSYPDWAMLDLFNVPFLPQKPYMAGGVVQPFRRLTSGGATIGRININNPVVPYPFSVTTAGVTQSPPRRNSLQALFCGLAPSRSYDSGNDPVYTAIDAAGSATLAQAIADYQITNGPFFMAGQIANVPEVANFLYTGVAASAVSRNDLVRDTIGAITTRSNVYSVWVVAQTIKKRASNTDYGIFQPGDIVTGEVRRQYLVERYLETGKDGIPGNLVSPSVANTPNAFSAASSSGDSIQAAYHPGLAYPLPYRWRVIAVNHVSL